MSIRMNKSVSENTEPQLEIYFYIGSMFFFLN